MILYHFTNVEHLESILAEGLRPGPGQEMPPAGVVWLTTATEPIWSQNYALGYGPPLPCRIKLAIPSRDRRLVRWWTWAHKHAPRVIGSLITCDCGIDHMPSAKSTWCYFGTVPLDCFTEAKAELSTKREKAKLLRMAARHVEVAA